MNKGKTTTTTTSHRGKSRGTSTTAKGGTTTGGTAPKGGTAAAPGGGARGYWSQPEEQALKRAVRKHGIGAWEKMRNDPEFTALRCVRERGERDARGSARDRGEGGGGGGRGREGDAREMRIGFECD